MSGYRTIYIYIDKYLINSACCRHYVITTCSKRICITEQSTIHSHLWTVITWNAHVLKLCVKLNKFCICATKWNY